MCITLDSDAGCEENGGIATVDGLPSAILLCALDFFAVLKCTQDSLFPPARDTVRIDPSHVDIQ